METYSVTFKKSTENKNSSVRRTKQNRLMLVSKCAVCGKKKACWKFIKNQEASKLELHETIVLINFKTNKILNKFLLAGVKFTPELYLRQPF